MDPKSINASRLIKEHTKGVLAGPIKPRWLSLALPKIGKHRAWVDHVVEGVLCLIIDAYRLGKSGKPFWKGPAYQVNRRELAWLLDCRLRDISKAVVALENWGLIWVARKGRYVNGEPKGTVAHAIPNVAAIADMLVNAQQKAQRLMKDPDDQDGSDDGDDTEVPDFGTQGDEVGHSSQQESGTHDPQNGHQDLNVPQRQYNAAAGRTAERVATTTASSNGHTLCSAAAGDSGGSGEADDDDDAASNTSRDSAIHDAPGTSSPAPGMRNGQRAGGPTSGAPSPGPYTPALQVERFVYFWSEAGRRSGFLELVHVSNSDRKALLGFFQQEQVSASWFAAVALRAWQAGDNVKKKGEFDPAWACRRSTDIQNFVRLRAKVLSELGSNGYEVNAYENLRWFFTDSELHKQGFKINAGLNVIDAKDAWENDEHAPAYYKTRNLDMPPEVRAAVLERSRDGNHAGT